MSDERQALDSSTAIILAAGLALVEVKTSNQQGVSFDALDLWKKYLQTVADKHSQDGVLLGHEHLLRVIQEIVAIARGESPYSSVLDLKA